jgi:hypothetical protein
MVASMKTIRNGSHASGTASAQHATAPVPKKPRKKRIFMPCTSAIEPSTGISSAMTIETMVCA